MQLRLGMVVDEEVDVEPDLLLALVRTPHHIHHGTANVIDARGQAT